jgi:anti-sigma regulatory factor (Ser/Thr protein kinase)
MRLTADEHAVARVTAWIEHFCKKWRLPRNVSNVISLSLDEIVSNIVVHGYERQPGKLSIALHYDSRAFSVVIEDGGKPFDPTQAVIPSTGDTLGSRREGGLGLLLVKNLMDDITYQRTGTINRLKLVKCLQQRSRQRQTGGGNED